MTASFDPQISFTRFTREGGLLTKRICLDENGKIIKIPAAQMTSGVAETIHIPFREFGKFLRMLQPDQAIAHGVTGHASINDVSASKFTGQPNTITRSKEYIKYSEGWGVAMLDHDPKPGGQSALAVDELIEAVTAVWPGFRLLPKWWTPSTSACIVDMDGNQLTGEGNGFHLYFPFAPASGLPDLAEVLFKRLWLKGHGYIAISRSGSMLIRSIFDKSVFSPERLDFCAGAVCEGCEQRLPDPVYFPAEEVQEVEA